jgi:hypothetical protein
MVTERTSPEGATQRRDKRHATWVRPIRDARVAPSGLRGPSARLTGGLRRRLLNAAASRLAQEFSQFFAHPTSTDAVPPSFYVPS